MKTVLLLGANGYIGSRLKQVLSPHYDVTAIDIGWHAPAGDALVMDYRHLTATEIQRFDVIIVLAAHSSVKTCEGPLQAPWLNNVTNFADLLSKVTTQLVIYASSASVYGNSLPGTKHSEQVQQFIPVNNYDVTKYVLDMHAEKAIAAGMNVIGLRFGTVNGWSPLLRTDVMINAMYETVMRTGCIQVSNSHISRAILGIEDLCTAVSACISQPAPGIYNLASFNLTVAEIAAAVADELDVKLVDNGIAGNAYDFSLDTHMFEKTFDFEFTATPQSILQSLISGYQNCRTQRRDQYINYDWTNKNDLE